MSAKIASFYKLHGNAGTIENFAEIIEEIRVATNVQLIHDTKKSYMTKIHSFRTHRNVY